VYPVANLSQTVSFLNEQLPLAPFELDGEIFEGVQGRAAARFCGCPRAGGVKRAITIRVCGSHKHPDGGAARNGKTMLAQRMAGILPPLSRTESLETTRIYSALGLLPEGIAPIHWLDGIPNIEGNAVFQRQVYIFDPLFCRHLAKDLWELTGHSGQATLDELRPRPRTTSL